MRVAVVLTIASLSATIFGCATPDGRSTPASSARKYLQFRHPVTGVPAFQVALPNSDGCVGMLATMRTKQGANDLLAYWSCVDTSASSSLPARATVRNKTYAFVFDIEAISLQECSSFVEAMLNSEGKDNLELVRTCAQR